MSWWQARRWHIVTLMLLTAGDIATTVFITQCDIGTEGNPTVAPLLGSMLGIIYWTFGKYFVCAIVLLIIRDMYISNIKDAEVIDRGMILIEKTTWTILLMALGVVVLNNVFVIVF